MVEEYQKQWMLLLLLHLTSLLKYLHGIQPIAVQKAMILKKTKKIAKALGERFLLNVTVPDLSEYSKKQLKQSSKPEIF